MDSLVSFNAIAVGVAVALLPGSPALAASPAPGWSSRTAASFECAQLARTAPQTGAVAGTTDGVFGSFAPGDVITLTVGLGTATSSSVTIVGDSDGDPFLAGPLIGPGSISYTVTGPLPAGAVGIGYYVNSTTPQNGTVNVQIACQDTPRVVPTWSPFAAGITITLLGLAGWRRRRGG